jgi:cyclophilin family peptidyl-prolyl cis-trans isomerase
MRVEAFFVDEGNDGERSLAPSLPPEDRARAYFMEYGDFSLTEPPPKRFGGFLSRRSKNSPRHRSPESRNPRWKAVGAIALAVVLIVVLVLTLMSKSPSSPGQGISKGGVSSAQSAVDAAAAKADCTARAISSKVGSSHSAPPSVLQPRFLYAAVVRTTAGTFSIALNPLGSRVALNDFVYLVEKGAYTCDAFSVVVPGEFALVGRPTRVDTGGHAYAVSGETAPVAANPADQYPLGSVALSNDGEHGGAQWFVVTGPQGESLPDRYILFGTVFKGMSVVEKINAEGSTSGEPRVVQRVLSVTLQRKKL